MVVHLTQAILNRYSSIPFLSLFSKDPADGADRTFRRSRRARTIHSTCRTAVSRSSLTTR